MMRVLYQERPQTTADQPPPPDLRPFHRSLGGAPTPLATLPTLAKALDVSTVDVKLETDRLGLPSFKIVGASWATVEALRPHLPSWWRPEHGLRPLSGQLPDVTLVAATDGNHGRALARVAAWLGLQSLIFVPESMSDGRVAAIVGEGARVVRVPGSYDDAVARSAVEAESAGNILVSDTSWPGYERVPAAVIDGYATITWEIEDQLIAAGRPTYDLVLVPIGVGSLAAAVIRHFRHRGGRSPRIVGVEPTEAACVMASLAAGRRLTVPGPHRSVMAGLNCGTPSYVAWPTIRDGLDAVVTVDDGAAEFGVRALAAHDIPVGECSGAVVAAMQELLGSPNAHVHRAMLSVRPDSSVLVFATDGASSAIGPAQSPSSPRTPDGGVHD